MQGWRCAPSSRSGVRWNLFIAVGFIPSPRLCAAAALSLFSTWADQLWSTIFAAHALQFQPQCFIWPGTAQVSIKYRKVACEDFRLLNQARVPSRWKKGLAAWLSSIILKWFHKCYPGMKLYIFFKKIPETRFFLLRSDLLCQYVCHRPQVWLRHDWWCLGPLGCKAL